MESECHVRVVWQAYRKDTIEMEDVWIRIMIAEDCMVLVIDNRLEFAVDEAIA